MRRWLCGVLAVMVVGLGGACGGSEPVDLVAPSEDAFGVMLLERTFRVRADDAVDARLYIPTEVLGEAAPGPHPVVLFVQGGLVKPEQYGWIGEHLASQGYLVVMPEPLFDLAIFSIGNGADVVEAMDRASGRSGDFLEGLVDESPAVVMGHSLGGVIATKTWLDRRERFSLLVLLQSIPDPSDADRLEEAAFEPGEVFAVAGEVDGRITVEEIAEELGLFAGEVPLAVVEGMNHFQMIDGPTASQQESDWPAEVSREVSRGRVLALLDRVLASRHDDSLDMSSSAAWPEGVVEP